MHDYFAHYAVAKEKNVSTQLRAHCQSLEQQLNAATEEVRMLGGKQLMRVLLIRSLSVIRRSVLQHSIVYRCLF